MLCGGMDMPLTIDVYPSFTNLTREFNSMILPTHDYNNDGIPAFIGSTTTTLRELTSRSLALMIRNTDKYK